MKSRFLVQTLKNLLELNRAASSDAILEINCKNHFNKLMTEKCFLSKNHSGKNHPLPGTGTQVRYNQCRIQRYNGTSSRYPLPLTKVQLYSLYNCAKKVVLFSCLKQRVLNSNYTNASIVAAFPTRSYWSTGIVSADPQYRSTS
jgi:hypothetical protein